MPPRKPKSGVTGLIGQVVMMESKYDDKVIKGILRSTDEDYLGLEIDNNIFYFSKYVIRAIHASSEEEVPSESP